MLGREGIVMGLKRGGLGGVDVGIMIGGGGDRWIRDLGWLCYLDDMMGGGVRI